MENRKKTVMLKSINYEESESMSFKEIQYCFFAFRSSENITDIDCIEFIFFSNIILHFSIDSCCFRTN